MSLSEKVKGRIRSAITNKDDADALIAAIESGANPQASSVAVIGTTSNLVGVDGTGSNAAPLAGTESRLDAVEAKIDAVITALKTAGLMA
jgi:hypothetical protein